MALFTDGAIASIEDLRGHDTQLLNVATVEDIDVTRKLALAQEEIAIELTGLLEQAMLSGQLAAPPSIEQVVVTTPLKLWHIFRTLEMVYRDAFNSQLNDRYAGKRDEYHEMAKWAYSRLVQSGLGMAANPVEQATTPDAAAIGGQPGGWHLLRRHRVDECGGRRGGEFDSGDDPGVGQFLRRTAEDAGETSQDGTCTAGAAQRR